MKKFLTIMVALLLCMTFMFGMVGCSKPESSGRVKLIDIRLTNEDYGIAINKEDATLLATVNQVLANKQTEIENVYKLYNETGVEEGYYVEDVVAYADGMNSDQYLVLATDYPFEPYEYMVGTNYAGIDIEIGKMIADELGKTLAIKYVAFDLICTTVNNGGADLGLAGLTITDGRKNTVNFSNPYETGTYQVIIVPEEVTLFDDCETKEDVIEVLSSYANGTKAGSQTGTTGAKYIQGDLEDAEGFQFTGYANLTLKTYTTHADAVRDMVNGQVSLCVVDYSVAVSIVNQINSAVNK